MGDFEAESRGSGCFEVVGFVDDEVIKLGQHAVAGGDIGQQEGMVDDEQVGALGGLASTVEGAGSAGAAHADLGFAAFIFCRDAHPNFAFDGTVEVDLVAVSRVGLGQPDQHFGQHAHLFDRGRAALTEGVQAAGT